MLDAIKHVTDDNFLFRKIAHRCIVCVTQSSSAANRSVTRFELCRHVEIARTCSNLVADRFEAKFHYAILVVDRSEAGRRPVADLLALMLACC